MALASSLATCIPSGYCLSSQVPLLAMHIASDSIIMLSYASISLMLWKYARACEDMQFRWIYILFTAFFLGCGVMHAMSLWTISHQDYVVEAVVKVITTIISIGTAIALWRLIPKIINLPGPAKWAALNNQLRQQTSDREQAEEEMERQTAALKEVQAQLEDELKERKLREAELQLAATVFETAINSIVVTDAYGRILTANPAFTALTGYKRYEVLGRNLADFCAEDHPEEQHQHTWNEVVISGAWNGERWCRRKDGSVFCQRMNINRVALPRSHAPRYVCIMLDATASRSRDEQLQYLALHDPLTGLANRALLLSTIDRALLHAKRESHHVALLFIHLDSMQAINQRLGRDAGDLLLQTQNTRLNALIRDGDFVARLGENEYVIMLDKLAHPANAETIAERALQRLSQPVMLGETSEQLHVSIGIACSPDAGNDAQTLIKHADTAMQQAKSMKGAGWHRYASDQMNGTPI